MKQLLFILSFIIFSISAQATVWTVDSTNNAGYGSLRAAADSASSGDTIRFSPSLITSGSDSITLTTGVIGFGAKGITIQGLYNTTDTLYISGNNNSPIFAFTGAGNVVFDSLTLVNSNGSAISRYNCSDTLFVTNSILFGNTSFHGGAIYSYSANGSSFIIVTNSTISENSAVYKGGGILSRGDTSHVILINSTLSGNTSENGAGISSGSNFNTSNASSFVTITNSTISGGSASFHGGAIISSADSSSVSITNSTLSGNSAFYYGGGIYSHSYSASSSSVSVTNSTISGNTALSGAGIYSPSAAEITVSSSIIAENGSNTNYIHNTVVPTIVSNGFNIFSDTLSGTIASDSINVTASQLNLLALAFNGGYTQTMLPGVGSIAINNGNPYDTSDAQNGPLVGIRDIGAADVCARTFFTDTISSCASYYTWIDGNTYISNNSEATHIMSNSVGCDSVITLNLTLPNLPSIDTVHACDSITWIDGQTYYPNHGIVSDTFTNVLGCDSVVYLNFIPSNYGVDYRAACDSLTWINGVTYYANNNSAMDTLTSSFGCDSVVTLDLIILHSFSIDTVNACDSYTWIDGITYTSSDTNATSVLSNVYGCDSTVTLNLTMNYSSTFMDTIVACDSLTWIDGLTYYVSDTTSKDTLVNAMGCDSIVSLYLTINNTTYVTDTVIACDSYTWTDGNTYTESNDTVSYTIPNSVGCDSVIQLDLTINMVDETVIRQGYTLTSQAPNASYQWLNCATNTPLSGATNAVYVVTKSGYYAVEVTENGCVDTSDCFAVIYVGVNELAENESVAIYPNPTSHLLNIESENFVITKIKVLDNTGKVVKTITSNFDVVNVANLATGIYHLELIGESEVVTKKFIKQ